MTNPYFTGAGRTAAVNGKEVLMDNGDIKKILAGLSLATLLAGSAYGLSGCASDSDMKNGSSCSGVKQESQKSSCSGKTDSSCSGKTDSSCSGKTESSCSGK